MATYTDNYNLKKPTYAEPANVKDINDNMDKVDEIMHSTQVSLADAYDLNSTYNTGDKVMYEKLMYKCKEDGVTGAWDASKWERTTAVEGSGADLDIYGEASGTAEASFSDGASASLVECEIGIVPTQDLHGYSKPWAGGAGKNKLDCSNATSGSLYGVDFTVNKNTDGAVNSIDASNTATSSLYYEIFRGSLTFDSDVILSGCPSGGSLQTYGLLYNNGIGAEYGTGTTISAGTTITSIGIRIGNGYTANNVTFKPMIRLATETDTTFAPYSNICPISGHTDVTVTVASTSGEDTTVSLGRTVYKGWVNLSTGEGAITGVDFDLSNAGATFYKSALTGADRFYSQISTIATDMKTSGFNKFLCDYFEEKEDQSEEVGTAYIQTGWLNIQMPKDMFATGEAFKTWIESESVHLVYELATPQTFTLTKEQIQTLLGQNYVSHDGGGTISLVYIKKDSTIIPNPTGAEIPLTGIEIDGEKFKIVPETEDIAEMEWTLLDSTTSTGTSTLIPEGTKYLVLVVDFSVSASIVAIESIKNIIKTMDITSKSVWNVGYEWCDTGGNHTYVAMSGDATHVQAYSGYNTVTTKVYAVS